jgi:hypothetical protein
MPGVARVPRRRGARHQPDLPEPRFEYRPLAVLEPFEGGPTWSMELEAFAADQGVRLVHDGLRAIDADRRLAMPTRAKPMRYDAVLVCNGARSVRAIPDALTFRGSGDADVVRSARVWAFRSSRDPSRASSEASFTPIASPRTCACRP